MALGSFLGGAVKGLQVGANLRQKRDDRAALERAEQEKVRTTRLAQINDNIKQAFDTADIGMRGLLQEHERAVLGGDDTPFNREGAQQFIDQILTPAAELIQTAQETGVLDEQTAGLRMQEIQIRRQAMGQALTQGELRQQKFIEQRQTKAANLGFSTDAGRRLGDIQLAADLFGQNSEQVKALEQQTADEAKPDVKLSDVRGMQNDFTKLSKELITVRNSFDRIQVGAEQDNGPGDMTMIFAYMKMLDPTSTVRESEFANAENSAALLSEKGVPMFFLRLRERALTGGRLAPEQRQEFLDTSFAIAGTAIARHKALEDQFRARAERAGINPEDVVTDFLGDLRDQEPQQLTEESLAEELGVSLEQIQATMLQNPDIKNLRQLRDSILEARRGNRPQ